MPMHGSSPVLGRLVWLGRAARLALEDPVEGLDRALHRSQAPQQGKWDRAWERHLHDRIGAAWLGARARFDHPSERRSRIEERVSLAGRVGSRTAPPARTSGPVPNEHGPQRVVETGVGRGVTTRLILEALQRRQSGHLWSIDRPPLDRRLHEEIGAAVPARLRGRWTLLRGTSRRVLPGLLSRIAPIDLFVHDSLHSASEFRCELARAWGAMDDAGTLVADDVDRSSAFRRFVDATPPLDSVIAPAADGLNRFGVALPAQDHQPLALDDFDLAIRPPQRSISPST